MPVPESVATDLSGAVTNLLEDAPTNVAPSTSLGATGGVPALANASPSASLPVLRGPQANEATVSVVGQRQARSPEQAMRAWLWLCALFVATVTAVVAVVAL
jgi:hypothetical protein